MLKCADVFLSDLQKKIDFSFEQGRKAELVLIEITNANKLKLAYDADFVDKLLIELCGKIKENLFGITEFVEKIDDEYVCLLIERTEDKIFEEIINDLHLLIKSHRSVNPEPIHLMSAIISVSINDELSDAKSLINAAYETSKNIVIDENKFHFTYQEIIENKTNIKNHFILADCLKRAILEKKLRLAYQPIISSFNGSIAHYECLLRILNEDGRIISAGPFIPIAESMGFINFIDEIVLEMVVAELKASSNIIFTFNLSSIGINNQSWLKKIQNLVNNELATRLIIEITETAAHRDLGKSAHFVATLQEIGCMVALDDFGAGNTSFRQLKVLPVDMVKIDGSFIKDLVGNKENQMFVQALVDMSKIFGLKCVAEFVENGEIAKMLIDLKVDYMQGNYFCPAVNYRSWTYEHQ